MENDIKKIDGRTLKKGVPANFHGKKGRSGRKKVKEEIITAAVKKNFRELVKDYLKDEKILREHRKLLSSDKDETKIKAIDMAYKLKNKYPIQGNLNINLSAEDLMKMNLKRKNEICEHSESLKLQ